MEKSKIDDNDVLRLFGKSFPKKLYDEAKDFLTFYGKWGFTMPDRHKKVKQWVLRNWDKEHQCWKGDLMNENE